VLNKKQALPDDLKTTTDTTGAPKVKRSRRTSRSVATEDASFEADQHHQAVAETSLKPKRGRTSRKTAAIAPAVPDTVSALAPEPAELLGSTFSDAAQPDTAEAVSPRKRGRTSRKTAAIAPAGEAAAAMGASTASTGSPQAEHIQSPAVSSVEAAAAPRRRGRPTSRKTEASTPVAAVGGAVGLPEAATEDAAAGLAMPQKVRRGRRTSRKTEAAAPAAADSGATEQLAAGAPVEVVAAAASALAEGTEKPKRGRKPTRRTEAPVASAMPPAAAVLQAPEAASPAAGEGVKGRGGSRRSTTVRGADGGLVEMSASQLMGQKKVSRDIGVPRLH
jgi:ribonuclease E